MAAGAHAQVDVRLGQLQVLEEHLRHVVAHSSWTLSWTGQYRAKYRVVVLAGVHQELLELLRVLRHLPHDGGGFHEVGAGTDDVEDFHQFFSLPRITRIFTKFSLPRIARIFTNFFIFVLIRETCPEVPPELDEGPGQRVRG